MKSAEDFDKHATTSFWLFNCNICHEFRNVLNDLMKFLGELPVTFEDLIEDISAII
jgi:hypothetical protein